MVKQMVGQEWERGPEWVARINLHPGGQTETAASCTATRKTVPGMPGESMGKAWPVAQKRRQILGMCQGYRLGKGAVDNGLRKDLPIWGLCTRQGSRGLAWAELRPEGRSRADAECQGPGIRKPGSSGAEGRGQNEGERSKQCILGHED